MLSVALVYWTLGSQIVLARQGGYSPTVTTLERGRVSAADLFDVTGLSRTMCHWPID